MKVLQHGDGDKERLEEKSATDGMSD